MHSKQHTLILLVILLSLALSGCGAGQLLGPTVTPSPTHTFTPTLTATPTFTPTPTPSKTPLPQPTPDRLLDLKLNTVSLQISDFPSDPIAYKMAPVYFIDINKEPVGSELIRKFATGFKREYRYQGNGIKIEDYFDLDIFLFRNEDFAKGYYTSETAIFRTRERRKVDPIGDQATGFYLDTYLVRYTGIMWRYKEAVVLMVYHGDLPATGEDIFRLADIVQARLEAALK